MNKIYINDGKKNKHMNNLFETAELIAMVKNKLKRLNESTKDWNRIDWINFISSLGKFKICIVNNAILELKG